MSEQNDRFIYKSEFLDVCLQKEDGVIIYGIGSYGSAVADYIIETGNKEKIRGIAVTDQKDVPAAYKNIPVSEAEICFRNEKNRKRLTIVAVSVPLQESIIAMLESFGIKKWYCLTRQVYLALMRKGDKRPRIPYRGVDFVVAGFTKCGTTSLHCVLRNIDSIFVPLEKETHFFEWLDKVENAEEKLAERYFSDIREGQTSIGMVEPTFYSYSKEIYQYFGPSVRIVLVMRNPVEAAFSLYKMENRCGSPVFEELYQKYRVYHHEEMFENYFINNVKKETYLFHYDYWLKRFYEVFPKEQVYVVFFEDMIKFPEREISHILEFIGINEKYTVSKIPKANEGNFVMKDLEGYMTARQRIALHRFRYQPFSEEKMQGGGYDASRLMELERKFGKADKLNLRAGKKEQGMLKQYFHTQVRNLENMLNRDLSEIWF